MEVQVGSVDARPGEFAQHARQLLDGEAAGCQQLVTDG